MIFGMSASEVSTLMTAIAVPLGVVGAGLKTMIARADARAKDREDDFEARIDKLEKTIQSMAQRELVLLRRVFELEGIMRARGIDLPATPGWPFAENA